MKEIQTEVINYSKNLLKKGKDLPQKILHQTGSVVD